MKILHDVMELHGISSLDSFTKVLSADPVRGVGSLRRRQVHVEHLLRHPQPIFSHDHRPGTSLLVITVIVLRQIGVACPCEVRRRSLL